MRRLQTFRAAGIGIAMGLLAFGSGCLAPPPSPNTQALAKRNRHEQDIAHNRQVTRLRGYDFELLDRPEAHPNVIRPVAEYERAALVALTDGFDFDSLPAKRVIAQNLPSDVKLLVIARGLQTTENLMNALGVPASRLQVLKTLDPNLELHGFWFRDSGPIGLWGQVAPSSHPVRAVVDTRYWGGFEPDTWLAPQLNAILIQPPAEWAYVFEGGNFMADTRGNCFLIDKEIPNFYFQYFFGCKTVTTLPCLKGICHIDESAKFISDQDVVTDLEEYVPIFATRGYRVHKLPRPLHRYETYVNSLIVNGRVFVPSYGQTSDWEALAVYESLGLTPVSTPASRLSNEGLGAIHCITQTYPAD